MDFSCPDNAIFEEVTVHESVSQISRTWRLIHTPIKYFVNSHLHAVSLVTFLGCEGQRGWGGGVTRGRVYCSLSEFMWEVYQAFTCTCIVKSARITPTWATLGGGEHFHLFPIPAPEIIKNIRSFSHKSWKNQASTAVPEVNSGDLVQTPQYHFQWFPCSSLLWLQFHPQDQGNSLLQELHLTAHPCILATAV